MTQLCEACCCGYIVISDVNSEPPVIYRGPDTAAGFFEALQEEEKIKAVLVNQSQCVI